MQKRWLEAAKVENNRLRERVRGQLKTVNGIKKILYRLTSLQKAGVMDGMLVRDYCLALEEGSTKFQVNGNHSMRKYIEPNRIVIVFAGMAQSVEALGCRVTGIEFRERGWIVVTQALKQEPDVCVVSSCCEVTLDVGSRLENPSAIAPELSRMLIAYKRKNFRSIQQELENRLVAQE
ncbi:hypothetical protein BBJ28_00004394 [Nothophytophthora sp. Chile5]|nr:hypothetical protein BBJ28_00004394 [Nothophytophthora sp. Chile5]